MAICFVLFGSVAAATTGIILDRTGKYLLMFRGILLSSTVVLFLSLFMIPSDGIWTGILWCILAGILLVPIVPVTFNFVAEITHPLSPAAVLCFTLIAANISLTLMNFGFVFILKNDTERGSIEALVLMAVFAMSSFWLSLFAKEDLRRMSSVSDLKLLEQQSMTTASSYGNLLSAQ